MAARHGAGKRTVILKLETTPGTPETLAAADYNIRFRTVEITNDTEMESDAKYLNGSAAEDQDIAGKMFGSVNTSWYLCGSGAAATAPNYFKAMQALGCILVTYNSDGTGVQPNKSAADKTATIWVIDETIGGAPVGIARKYAGCAGNGVLAVSGTGKPYGCAATYTGKLVQPTDIDAESLLAMTGMDTTPAQKLLNNSATIFSKAVCISSYSLDMGNEVLPMECQSDTNGTGIDHFYISSRKPRLTLNPDSAQVATRDPYAMLKAETTGVIELESALTTPPLTISVPVAQLIAIGDEDVNGVIKSAETYKCCENDGVSIANLTNTEATWELLHYERSEIIAA